MIDMDVNAVAARIKARNAIERKKIQERRLRAREIGREAAARLAESAPELVRVWGFGSTFEADRPYRLDSDLDLAVEGGDTLGLLRLVEDYGISVDLVDLAEVSPLMASIIRERGTVLYSRDEAGRET